MAAGVAYAVTATVVLLTLYGQELLPLRTATVAFVFVWPLVPTVALVAASDRRTTALAVSVYAAVIIALGALGEAGVAGVLTLWAIFTLPASLILAGVAGRRLRAVGPFLAPSVFVIGAGLMVWPWIALPIVSAGASAETAQLLLPVAGLLVFAPYRARGTCGTARTATVRTCAKSWPSQVVADSQIVAERVLSLVLSLPPEPRTDQDLP